MLEIILMIINLLLGFNNYIEENYKLSIISIFTAGIILGVFIERRLI